MLCQVHETFDFAAKCQGVGHKHGKCFIAWASLHSPVCLSGTESHWSWRFASVVTLRLGRSLPDVLQPFQSMSRHKHVFLSRADNLQQLLEKEQEQGITPDPVV